MAIIEAEREQGLQQRFRALSAYSDWLSGWWRWRLDCCAS